MRPTLLILCFYLLICTVSAQETDDIEEAVVNLKNGETILEKVKLSQDWGDLSLEVKGKEGSIPAKAILSF